HFEVEVAAAGGDTDPLTLCVADGRRVFEADVDTRGARLGRQDAVDTRDSHKRSAGCGTEEVVVAAGQTHRRLLHEDRLAIAISHGNVDLYERHIGRVADLQTRRG